MKYLLLFIPITIVLKLLYPNELILFTCSALSLVALSGILGNSIETISEYTFNKVGSLLNATLGNAAELIFTVIALKAGQIELVKASIIGALLGNLLLLPALAMIVGGLKNGSQFFDKETVSHHSTMMTLSIVGFILPTLFEILRESQNAHGFKVNLSDKPLLEYSVGIAILFIVVYLLSVLYSFSKNKKAPGDTQDDQKISKLDDDDESKMSLKKSLLLMFASTLLLVWMSDILVASVDKVLSSLHLSATFLGIILIPILSDVAEHMVAVQQAYKNKMDLSLSITLESASQIALFVAPLLVIISFFMGKNMTLFFSPFEIAILGLSLYIMSKISEDGECNWFEGTQLMVVYIIAAIGFYFL